jgi:hypothetical protein
MMRVFFSSWLVICSLALSAQGVDEDLLRIKQRLDSVVYFQANLQLETDISFVHMPVKRALMKFEKGKPVQFISTDFVLLPKRGLDFSLQSLFEYRVVTLVRNSSLRSGYTIKEINVIPADKRADFTIATLWINTSLRRVESAEISTSKDGTYVLQMHYHQAPDIFPDRVEVSFEIERIRIPLNFMGKGTQIDKEKLKSEGAKTGKIFMMLSNYQIRYKAR